jgi:hypothetical protein
MTSENLSVKELDSVGELLTKLERVVAVTLSDFNSDMERERAKAKKPSAKAAKTLAATFEKAWFDRCSGFADLAKLLVDVAAVGSACGRDMLGTRKLANGLKSAIAGNHLAGALGSQEALIRLSASTADAVAEVEVLAEQLRNAQQKGSKASKGLKRDDYQEAFKRVDQLPTIKKISHIANGLRVLCEGLEFIGHDELSSRTDEDNTRLLAAIQYAADGSDVESWFQSHGPDALFKLAQFRASLPDLPADWKLLADVESDMLAFADWLDMLCSCKSATETKPLSGDDWVLVPYKKQRVVQMYTSRATCYAHGNDPKKKDVIRRFGDGDFLIRRRFLDRYVKENLLKTYMEKPAFDQP